MSAVLALKDLPAIGTPFEGGHLFGQIMVDRNPHAVIVSGRAFEHPAPSRWHKNLKRVAGALSYYDSFLNTESLADAGSPLAQWARQQEINGKKDWCIPARDVLELMYRVGKPTARKNACWYRDGENPSSIQVGYPYTEDCPAQTNIEAFREGGPEAFEPVAYWSSTQFEANSDYAWAQRFSDGVQYFYRKDHEFRCRLVRLISL